MADIIPGFDSHDGSEVNIEASSKTFLTTTIPAGSEWRLEVPSQSTLRLSVVSGVAEIYGTELPLNVEFLFNTAKLCVYAPESPGNEAGCTIQYTTQRSRGLNTSMNSNSMNSNSINSSNNNGGGGNDGEISEYISEETSMNQYINLHFALEAFRERAASDSTGGVGPKVLVIGNSQSGKTVLLKTLAAYALKMDRCPIYVNLNPAEGVFSLPGSITATPISDMFEVDATNGWGNTTTSGVTFHNPKQPIVKSFGFEKFQDNLDLYKYQVSKLGVAVMSRLQENDLGVRLSGVLVDTPPLTIKDFSVIESIVSDFEIDLIVVIGNERLVIELKKKFKHKTNNLNIIKLNKSGGVVEVDDTLIRHVQQQTIREYFYGSLKTPLSPYNTVVDMKDIVIYKPIETLELNSSLAFLPSGDLFTPEIDEFLENANSAADAAGASSSGFGGGADDFPLDKYYTKITDPDASVLNNAILAITQLPANEKLSKKLMNTCVMGYAYVSDVDDTKKK